MAVIGFNLTKIFVERKKALSGKVDIRTNIDIKEIKKEEIAMIKGQDVLSFDFAFTVNYDPEVAKLLFEGNILFTIDPKESKDIINKWKKKEIADEIKLNIFNTIFAKCTVKALELEEELNLPTHIPIFLSRKEKQEKQEKK